MHMHHDQPFRGKYYDLGLDDVILNNQNSHDAKFGRQVQPFTFQPLIPSEPYCLAVPRVADIKPPYTW